jgi:uncharacterized protein with PIN domain
MSNSASRKRAAKLRHSQIRAKAPAPPEQMESLPRFVADVMLGRLAKWLRIAGFDVLYSNRFTDDELVTLSRREARILLSRDTRLLVRKAVKQFIFLESDKVQDQIRQIFDITHTTDIPGLLTRCLSCNELLNEVPRETVRETVPPYVYATQTLFKSCPKCRKIYWAGTHRQSVVRILEALISKP